MTIIPAAMLEPGDLVLIPSPLPLAAIVRTVTIHDGEGDRRTITWEAPGGRKGRATCHGGDLVSRLRSRAEVDASARAAARSAA